ncbi:RNA binding protein [Sistotremastrum niveocremeum HHB9708]|uniref:RNA binding protein n=2 Tax=Sistotremastraceae TaxID=3402574 RepID=A0A164UH26_9AGAM|nr:RNA binding protein [Sistotremastrum niveocremeum HHB9708]KZT36028.1 RNA binding protein [Sistotremastrum suecicum HHB10207 ss-3]
MAEISDPPAFVPATGPMEGIETSAPPEPVAKTEDAEKPAAPSEPNATETLYIQNLNEKIKISVMKQTLTNLFANYGEVLDVVAHRNIRMRGQAFVSFKSADIAKKAQKEANRFPLYTKPMQISFARTPSDAFVKAFNPDKYDQHHQERLERKRKGRIDNPLKRKARAKKLAAALEGGVAAPGPKRPAVQMPDEYLPPNKILFLQNLPESVEKDQLTSLFSQFPNLYEVRLIPSKKDIAFVEYLDEGSATVAKDALHNYKLDGENKIKVRPSLRIYSSILC